MGRAVEEIFLLCNDLADLVTGWSMQTLPRGSSMHLKGSCRMGDNPANSVVSPEGRLWGYENCYVAGNAVLGECSSGNPTPASVAFALNTADVIRDAAA
jgi:C-glycoside oxidase